MHSRAFAVPCLCLNRASLPTLSLILWCSVVLVQAQPVNDNFSSRSPITGEEPAVSASNLGATIELGEPAEITENAAGSIWWTWTAPKTGTYSISTAETDFDTVLAVYLGNAISDLTLIAANDDEDVFKGIFTSQVNFWATAGTAFQIVVAGLRAGPDAFAAGTIRLQLRAAAATPAPIWEAVDLDGNVIKSTEFAGRVLLIDFWATWCAPCRAEIPIFIELQNRFRDAGLTVVGASVDTAGPEAIRAFMKELGMNYPVAMTNPKLEQDFGGIGSIPTAFVIDRRNNLVLRHSGFGDREFWERTIGSLFVRSGLAVRLKIERMQDGIRLSWPDGANNFVIEESTSLAQPIWQQVLRPSQQNGGFWTVEMPTNRLHQFFRLIQR